MEKSRLNLGGAGLVDNSNAPKGVPLAKPAVGFVHGSAPKPAGKDDMPVFGHSPIKAKGKGQ